MPTPDARRSRRDSRGLIGRRPSAAFGGACVGLARRPVHETADATIGRSRPELVIRHPRDGSPASDPTITSRQATPALGSLKP
ncbi:MAG: hypothetical protein JWM85_3144, partial [Acidimicrobiaceae bacterium]|nr:hypothetical protein [Acidimicrobiaceae bacterium]